MFTFLAIDRLCRRRRQEVYFALQNQEANVPLIRCWVDDLLITLVMSIYDVDDGRLIWLILIDTQ